MSENIQKSPLPCGGGLGVGETQSIKQGYKQTSLGILPQEWEVVRLGDICEFIKTYQNARSDLNKNDEISYIHYGEIHTKYKHFIDFAKAKLPKINAKKLVKEFQEIAFCQSGDLVVVDASEDYTAVAKSVEIQNLNSKAVAGLHTFLLRDKANYFANGFKGYILYNSEVYNELKRLATGISVLSISKTNLSNLQIPLPPLAEQEKIAQILGVWDKGISVLKSLIEAKTKRKKALMQRLLTPPKTSHTDFSSCHSDKVCHTEPFSCHTERSEVSKNKGVDFVDTLAFSKHQYDEVLDSCNSATLCHTEGVARSIQKDDLQGNAVCLDSSVASLPQNDRGKLHNVKNKPNESSLRFAEFTDKWQEMRLGDICEITTGSLNANAMVESGKFAFFTCAREVYAIDNYAFDTEALLVSGNGANVGYIHYYKGKFNAYQRTYVLDKFSCDILFVKFFLDKYLKKRIAQEKNEGNTPYIVLSTLQDMKIVLPNSLAEQKKIAQVLSACDKEIELLKSKFQCLKTQKKGLMQRLLNGEVRVKC
mgnify:CR=1 FL=1